MQDYSKTWGTYISDYAREHGINPSHIVALIVSDDDAPRPMFERSSRIVVDGHIYSDGYYSREYLDLVLSGVIED